jgi:hypothetical protein
VSVERAPVPDSQQRGLLTQYYSHTADKPPSLMHTHSPSESNGTTHRPCCQSSARRIVPAVLLVAVTVVKDIDEVETSPPLTISADSPPPLPSVPRSIPAAVHTSLAVAHTTQLSHLTKHTQDRTTLLFGLLKAHKRQS